MPTTYRKITESKFVDIERCVPANPIALYWLNKLGGWDMWVFGLTQTKGLQVKGGETFEQFIEDLADANKRAQWITKRSTPQIVMGYSNVPTDKVLGIQGVLDSPRVLMLVSEMSVRPPVFLHVMVEDGDFKTIETESEYHDLELTVSLPENFNQSL